MNIKPFLYFRHGKPDLRTAHPHIADSNRVHVEYKHLAIIPYTRFDQRSLFCVQNLYRYNSRATLNKLFQQRIKNLRGIVNHMELEKRLRAIYLFAIFAYLA